MSMFPFIPRSDEDEAGRSHQWYGEPPERGEWTLVKKDLKSFANKKPNRA